MEFLTKEKSKQKRKSVNNQNNSIELFPVINTGIHHHHKSNKNQLRKDQEWF
jgi:Na+-transporting methylmalonyl-CoA/oxaloacetate decarboxylase gamma subunit